MRVIVDTSSELSLPHYSQLQYCFFPPPLPSHIPFTDCPKWIGRQRPADQVQVVLCLKRVLLKPSTPIVRVLSVAAFRLRITEQSPCGRLSDPQSQKYLQTGPSHKSLLAPSKRRGTGSRKHSIFLLPQSAFPSILSALPSSVPVVFIYLF